MKIRKISQKQEKEVAEQFRGKTTIASGALWFQKSDVISDKCNLECKTTSKDYYSVSANVWEKIEKEAVKEGDKIPLLVVDMQYKHSTHRFIVFKDSYFENIFSYEIDMKEESSKSRKLRASDVEDLYPLDALNFKICGKKEHNLFCMYDHTFIEIFGRELNL